MRPTFLAVALTAALTTTVAPANAIPSLATGALASDNIELVATIPDTLAIGAKIIDGYMYVTTSNGLRIYDVSQGIPILTGQLALPHFENESVDTNGDIALISADYFLFAGTGLNVLAVIDVRNKNLPVLQGITLQEDGHTATCIDDCRFAWSSGGETFDLRDPSNPINLGGNVGSVHNWNLDATGLMWGTRSFGSETRLYDVNDFDPAAGPTALPFTGDVGWHHSIRPNAQLATPASIADGDIDPGELVIGGPEDLYDFFGTSGNCNNDGYVQTTWFNGDAGTYQGTMLDRWNVGRNGTLPNAKPIAAAFCSSHWVSEYEGLVAAGWYEQGTRILDVSDPRDIKQVGYFMPATSQTWAAYFNEVTEGPFGGGLYVYTMDFERGIDVFKLDATAGASPEVLAPRLNPTSAAFGPSDEYGWACRVPVAGGSTL